MAEAPEGCERALQRLLGLIGSADPAGPALRLALAECEGERPGDAKSLRRLVALNAMAQDAVRRELDSVARQLLQVRAVREGLAQAAQAEETGDSCDVRG